MDTLALSQGRCGTGRPRICNPDVVSAHSSSAMRWVASPLVALFVIARCPVYLGVDRIVQCVTVKRRDVVVVGARFARWKKNDGLKASRRNVDRD